VARNPTTMLGAGRRRMRSAISEAAVSSTSAPRRSSNATGRPAEAHVLRHALQLAPPLLLHLQEPLLALHRLGVEDRDAGQDHSPQPGRQARQPRERHPREGGPLAHHQHGDGRIAADQALGGKHLRLALGTTGGEASARSCSTALPMLS
jgi:hypothetical protein